MKVIRALKPEFIGNRASVRYLFKVYKLGSYIRCSFIKRIYIRYKLRPTSIHIHFVGMSFFAFMRQLRNDF